MTGKSPSALRALVLDAQDSHALCAIRALGRRGIHVTAVSPKLHAMGILSRYCRKALHAPNPSTDPNAYADWLQSTLESEHFDALLFFGEASANVVAQHRDAIRARTGCLVPDHETFLTADRKDRVARLAAAIGVPVPATHELGSPEDAAMLAQHLAFPVVVKAAWGSGGHQVGLARGPEELRDTIHQVMSHAAEGEQARCLVQEFIPGVGYGFTALAQDGEVIAAFMHRRLAEHDIGRGSHLAHAATGAVSVDEDELRASGTALLRALRWDGMAMVEFRRSTRDGHFYLMEVNPRFPGSLDLAVAAGVDFPVLYAERAAGLAATGPDRYPVGLRYRWLLSKGVAEAAEDPFGYVRSVVSILRPDTRCDLALGDPRPHLAQLREAAWWLRQNLSASAAADGARRRTAALRAKLAQGRAWALRPRSYVPLAFFAVILLGMHGFTYPDGNHNLDLAWEAACLSLGILGLALRVATVGFSTPGGTDGAPRWDAARRLETTGMYSLMRHPYFVGTLLMWIGLASFPRQWWLPVLAIAVFWLYSKHGLESEEERQRRQGGSEYAAWAAMTPKFLPRWSLWKRPERQFVLGKVLRREHTALFVLVTCFTVLEMVGEVNITSHFTVDIEWGSLFITTAVAYAALCILKLRRYAQD